MTTKRILILLFLILLSILLATKFLGFPNNKTTITIRNQTDKSLENLFFSSNDSEKDYSISKIEPHTNISFKYSIGGVNENAVNLKHISESGNTKNYNIIGYVDKVYSTIYIDIVSISQDGELDIKVETLK